MLMCPVNDGMLQFIGMLLHSNASITQSLQAKTFLKFSSSKSGLKLVTFGKTSHDNMHCIIESVAHHNP